MKSSRPGPSARSGLFRSSSFFAVDEADLALAEDAAAVHDGAAIVDLQAALPPRDALMVPLSNIAVQRRPEDLLINELDDLLFWVIPSVLTAQHFAHRIYFCGQNGLAIAEIYVLRADFEHPKFS